MIITIRARINNRAKMRKFGPNKLESALKHRLRHAFTSAVALVGQEE